MPAAPATRRELLRAAAGASAALAAGTASAGAAPALAAADSGPAVTRGQKIDRLQRLARVELLLEYCYRHVLDAGILTPRQQRSLATFPTQVAAHVAALRRELAALGGLMPAGPESVAQANRFLARRQVGGRLGQLRGDKDALRLLLAVEQVVIGAYFVALLKLEEPHLVELCAQIMANCAQHDAVLRLLLARRHRLAAAAPYGLVKGLT